MDEKAKLEIISYKLMSHVPSKIFGMFSMAPAPRVLIRSVPQHPHLLEVSFAEV